MNEKQSWGKTSAFVSKKQPSYTFILQTPDNHTITALPGYFRSAKPELWFITSACFLVQTRKNKTNILIINKIYSDKTSNGNNPLGFTSNKSVYFRQLITLSWHVTFTEKCSISMFLFHATCKIKSIIILLKVNYIITTFRL